MIIARNATKGSGDLRTYIFHVNFQCLADDVDQALDCFQENSHLFYKPNEKKDAKPAARTCPLLSVEIITSPNERVAPWQNQK